MPGALGHAVRGATRRTGACTGSGTRTGLHTSTMSLRRAGARPRRRSTGPRVCATSARLQSSLQTRASGNRTVLPNIKGVVRQRYPIAPIHEAGSAAWKEAKALQELVVNKGNPHIAAIIAEKRAMAEGVHLQLGGGGGHAHTISLSPAQARQLRNGEINELVATSSTASAHVVLVTYSAAGGYAIDWCTQEVAIEGDECPISLHPGGCGTSVGGRPCCYGRCPDGHAVVSGPAP
eukprot:TRINITY_DN11585_c0_g1_i3.p1 TRINITY_DN11585_c0_g1~~TRINITY_DN11585_c0_g1_i3.p1  ORF type:complete len:235 (+),score=24.46 TRINITY_DN11585_c0_g1_i3:405-1109(+)